MKVFFYQFILIFLILPFFFSLSSCVSFERGPSSFKKSPLGARVDSDLELYFLKKKTLFLDFFSEASLMEGDEMALFATNILKKEMGESQALPSSSLQLKSKDFYDNMDTVLNDIKVGPETKDYNFVLAGRILRVDFKEMNDDIGLVRKHLTSAEIDFEIKVYDLVESKEIFSELIRERVDESSRELYNTQNVGKEFYTQQMFRKVTAKAVAQIIDKMRGLTYKYDWTGRVAKILNNKIYINAGKLTGLKIGNILKVMTPETQIIDSGTKMPLGLANGQLKATLEVIDFFGEDGAIAVLHSGGAVYEGDLVQLY